jgi:hypothetical protein
MRVRRGQVLVYILVSVGLLITIAMQIITWSLQVKAMRARVVRKEGAIGRLEGARARLWGCLADNGYPAADSCSPTAAQRACLPPDFSAEFSGEFPECRVLLTER